MNFIGRPMGIIINFFYNFLGDFFLSIILFALVIAVLRIPLDILTQKGASNQFKLRPQQDAIRRKFPNDRMRQNQEIMALNQREKVSMFNAGCLGNLFMMPFLFGIFAAMRNPITLIAGISDNVVREAGAVLAALRDYFYELNLTYINVGSNITEHDIMSHSRVIVDNYALVANTGAEYAPEISEASIATLRDLPNTLDLSFFGHGDLSMNPSFGEPYWLLLIPLAAGLFSLLPALIQVRQQALISPPGTPKAMGAMAYLMPIISLVMAFNFPAALGIYWAFSNLFGGAIRFFVNKKYTPQIICAKADCDLMQKQEEREQSIMRRIDGNA